MKELSYTKMKDSARRASNSDTSSLLDRISAFLVQHANPSVVYHVKNDILKNITDGSGGLPPCLQQPRWLR